MKRGVIFCPRVSSLKVSRPPTPIFIARLELTFVAAKPPPSHVFTEVALMAAEDHHCSIGHVALPDLRLPKEGQGGITKEEAKTVGDWYLKARNEANLALLDKIYSPGVIVHDPSQPENIVGLDSLKNQYKNTHTTIPDVKFSLDEMYIKGDKMAWIFTMSGTITGPIRTPFGDLPPTGKTFRLSGVAIDRIVEGKIAEEWVWALC
jgi:predicted ester cyclase